MLDKEKEIPLINYLIVLFVSGVVLWIVSIGLFYLMGLINGHGDFNL